MILYESNIVKLEYDTELKIIIWTPEGFVTGEEWTKPFLIGIDFFEKKIKEHPELGWLNDVRKLKTVKTEDVIWLNDINKIASEAGAKKLAFVLPKDVFGKLAVRLYAHVTSKQRNAEFEVKAFNTLKEAKDWLTGVETKVNEIRLA